MGRFQHGVASGDPLDDRVVIWTRVSDERDEVPVDWVLARDAELASVVASGRTTTGPERDHTVSVDVTGLESAATYWYGFDVAGERSPTGRTRTLPGAEADHLRFAMVSCAKFNAGYFNAYARIAARDDLDFLLHLGDYIYEASNTPPPTQTPGADIGRPFEPLHECVTLDDYRRRYAQYRRDPDVQRLHAAHAIVAAIDDHELADGAWRDGAADERPEFPPWPQRKADAFRARNEWIPARLPDPSDATRIYRAFAVGELADVLVLDTRSRRDEPVPAPAMDAPERSALGVEQRAWLFGELESSAAMWRLLANPSVMAKTWSPDLPDAVKPALTKVKLLEADGDGPDWDQWDGYPAERTALLAHLGRLRDTVILSGDVHVSLAVEMDVEGDDGTPVAVEFVTPSLTSQNLDDKMGWARRTDSLAIERQIVDALPHWHWCDLDSHGFVVIDVDRERVRAEWWHLDTVLERSEQVELGAAFEVRRGVARLSSG